MSAVQGGMCTLFIPDRDKVISVASEHLEPVIPEKGDRVSAVYYNDSVLCYNNGWLSSRVVSVLDSSAEGPGFK